MREGDRVDAGELAGGGREGFLRRVAALRERAVERGFVVPADGDDAALAAWLAAPAPEGPPGVSRILADVWAGRPDLQEAFPGIEWRPEVRDRFLLWAHHFAASECGLPAALVPPAPPGVTDLAVPSEPSEPLRPLARGVSVVGYLDAALGLGGAARRLVGMLERAGERVDTRTYGHTRSPRVVPWRDRPAPAGARADVLVAAVNGPETARLLRALGADEVAGRTVVGLWFWELEDVPDTYAAGFAGVDEVWTASAYTAAALHRVAPAGVEVHAFPLGWDVPRQPPPASGVAGALRRLGRAGPALVRGRRQAERSFRFGFAFDAASRTDRKNPEGVAEAYRRAFPTPGRPVSDDGRPAALVLKSMGAWAGADDAIGGRPDIRVIEADWAEDQQHRFIAGLDCYVSLHRAEGYGATLLEAMARGVPTIATAWSGNLEFMDAGGSWLVGHGWGAVPEGLGIYPAGARWAEPDLDAAAAAMREVAAGGPSVRARAQRGAADVAPLVAGAPAVAWLRDRLRVLRSRPSGGG